MNDIYYLLLGMVFGELISVLILIFIHSQIEEEKQDEKI
jgi:hypothetical protein